MRDLNAELLTLYSTFTFSECRMCDLVEVGSWLIYNLIVTDGHQCSLHSS